MCVTLLQYLYVDADPYSPIETPKRARLIRDASDPAAGAGAVASASDGQMKQLAAELLEHLQVTNGQQVGGERLGRILY